MQQNPTRFYVVGHACFSRPGPRIVDGIEQLASLIHPGCLPFSHARDALQLHRGCDGVDWLPVFPDFDPDFEASQFSQLRAARTAATWCRVDWVEAGFFLNNISHFYVYLGPRKKKKARFSH